MTHEEQANAAIDDAVNQILRAAGNPTLDKYMSRTQRGLRGAVTMLRARYWGDGYRAGYEAGRKRGMEMMRRKCAND